MRSTENAHPTFRPLEASIEQVTPDGDLVKQVRAGNQAAFGELVDRHQAAVYRAALAVLGNTADAEDVAQDALVLAYKRIRQYRGDASVRTWMVSIAWRLSLSHRRRMWWRMIRNS
jgi:RNA polymerase sigma-70 factor (ECF subfamily)